MAPTDPSGSDEQTDQRTVTTDEEGTDRDGAEGGWGTDTHSGNDTAGWGDNTSTRDDQPDQWGNDDGQWGESGWDDTEPSTQKPRSTSEPERQYCNDCGFAVPPDAQHCPECGTPLATQSAGPAKEPLGRLPAALIGGVAGLFLAIFLSFIPVIGGILILFGILLGGALSGYFRGPDSKESAITGGLAGVVTAIPLFLLVGLVGIFVGFAAISDGTSAGGGIVALVLIVVFIGIGTAMTVGAGALGGALGATASDRASPNDN